MTERQRGIMMDDRKHLVGGRDRQETSRKAGQFPRDPGRVAGMLQNLDAIDGIERATREWKMGQSASAPLDPVADARYFGETPSRSQPLGISVDRDNAGACVKGTCDGKPTVPTPDIGNRGHWARTAEVLQCFSEMKAIKV